MLPAYHGLKWLSTLFQSVVRSERRLNSGSQIDYIISTPAADTEKNQLPEVLPMSLIQCTDPCVYQLDGRCTLVRAASQGQSGRLGCVNFVPRSVPVRGPGPGWTENASQEP